MTTPQEKWIKDFEEMGKEVGNWRKENRKATFNAIESKLEERWAKLRADMLKDLIKESELAEFKDLPKEKRPDCPSCGKPLASNGKQKRTLTTTYNEKIEIERQKGYCANCRVSYFPPR
jgi:tRNA(Ile2) C34 agmatinyltransferase TiaS